MPKQRRNFSGPEKMAILREHLLEKVPISEICDRHGLQPTLFYQWQKKLFEQGAAVFDQPRRKSSRQQVAETRKMAARGVINGKSRSRGFQMHSAFWNRIRKAAVVALWLVVAAAAESGGEVPAAAGSFSLVALPDTQAYSAKQPEVFYAETQWVVDNTRRQQIVFVTHLGDIVNDNVPEQWAVARRAMNKLDGKVPYGMSVGNHDMKCGAGDASLFSATFPANRYQGLSWYGGQIRDNANSYQTFEGQGLRFVILHLECNAPDEVLLWADGVLEACADRRAIITTHMFLGPLKRPTTSHGWYDDPKGMMQWKKCHGKTGNTPAQLWDKCFSKHGNVFLILCGDQSRTQAMRMTLTGMHGNKVQVCLSDYRGGYFRIYRFEPKENRIRVTTYSATSRSLCRGTDVVPAESEHQFTLDYAMRSR